MAPLAHTTRTEAMASDESGSSVGPLTGGLLLLNAAMVTLLWLASSTTIDTSLIEPDVMPAAELKSDPAGAAAFNPPSNANKLNATLERPLFRADRRPPPLAAAVPHPVGMSAAQPAAAISPPGQLMAFPSDIRLVGIVDQSGQSRRAVFRTGGSGTSLSLQVGEMLDQWRIADIAAETVVLESRGRREVLQLYASEKPRVGDIAKP